MPEGNHYIRAAATLLVMGLASACSGPTQEEELGVDEGRWEAESVNSEASSTHLWIVDHAIDILAKHPGSGHANGAHELLTRSTCRARWQQGLFDADFLHEFNHGSFDLQPGASVVTIALSGANWKSHFFDPDTRLNSKGESNPTAFTQALRHLQNARDALANDASTACYEFGLSLHYLTDLTQPMHAANFTALDRPVGLHSDVETFAMDVQSAFVLADWSGPSKLDVQAFILDAAHTSKANWTKTFNALADAYEAAPDRFACGSLRSSNPFIVQRIDHSFCWNTNLGVKASVGESLRHAQDVTAQYLAIVGDLKP